MFWQNVWLYKKVKQDVEAVLLKIYCFTDWRDKFFCLAAGEKPLEIKSKLLDSVQIAVKTAVLDTVYKREEGLMASQSRESCSFIR